MAREEQQFAHPELVSGGETSKHSHAGGGNGFTYTAINPPTETTVTTINVWEAWDLSSYIPSGARYAVVYMRSNSTGALTAMVRKNGDTSITNTVSIRYYDISTIIVELDADRVVERRASNVSNAKFGVWGYIT
jgi:hypothetical protein